MSVLHQLLRQLYRSLADHCLTTFAIYIHNKCVKVEESCRIIVCPIFCHFYFIHSDKNIVYCWNCDFLISIQLTPKDAFKYPFAPSQVK